MKDNFYRKKIPNTHRGIMVAFIGQDGAGKSTVTDDIIKWLDRKIEVKKFYLGSGDHYHSIQKYFISKIHSKSLISKIFTGIFLVSDAKKLARRTKRTIKKADKYAHNGGIAIFDRFPQNAYLGINDGPKIRANYLPKITNKFIKKYVLWCAGVEEKNIKQAIGIEPDIVFKLLLSPEESLRRKPEENIDNVRKKHEIITSLKFNSARVVTIDATMDYENELNTIKNILWKELYKKQ